MKEPLVIIAGPTAVGKSALAVALAKKINGAVISADSMQVYQHMDIGSAKISKEEMQDIPHYLIDEFEPSEEFNVVKFQQYAYKYMKEIYDKGQIPILTGGTGFYIQALLYHIDFTREAADDSYRKSLESLAKREGPHILHEMLRNLDAKSADVIHENNVKRVIRALEYYKNSGQKISDHNEEQRRKKSDFNYAYFVLTDNRDRLYEKIDARVDKMLKDGLLEEVKALRSMGFTRDMVSMQGLGYKELLAYLDGEFTIEEAVRRIKRDTRHFAKRQLTWFKREQEVIWLNKADYQNPDEELLFVMQQVLTEQGIWEG